MCERGEKEIQNKNDMKKYQLYRPLLYQDRRSIDEFIKEDPHVGGAVSPLSANEKAIQ